MGSDGRSAIEKLINRIDRLACVFRYVSVGLIVAGIFLPIVSFWVLDLNLGYVPWALILFGFLFAVGNSYCKYIMEQFEEDDELEAKRLFHLKKRIETLNCPLCCYDYDSASQLRIDLKEDGYGDVYFCPRCGRKL